MKKALQATLLHMTSTDEAPDHSLCPQGKDSWCGHNRALADGKEPPAHKEALPTERDKLFACAGTRRSFRGPKHGRYPAVEEAVKEWVSEQRSKRLSVSYDDIEGKARAVAIELGIDRNEFKISKKWVANFMKRNGLSLRRRTTVCQRLPDAYEEKRLEFHRYVAELRTKNGFMLDQIGNADQTPVWFDMPSRRTVSEKGERQVRLLTTGNEHNRFTAMLCCTADGHKLPPFLVFKRKTMPTNQKFPPKVIIRVNEKGFFNEDTVLDWFRLVWCRRPGTLLKARSMLVLDSFRGHSIDHVKKTVANAGCDLVIIPGGMTSILQPLDVVLNKPFKERVGILYNDWLSQDDNPKTPTG
ncbi:Pogo transposable element with KRAB domain [Ixodes scapularis]